MSIEILHNRTDHTHENEQFRRVAEELEIIFEEKNYDGLLIGNPFHENFDRFRPDALLFYTHGLVLIDFKDYQGNIPLPADPDKFHTEKWYKESEKDRSCVDIKAGSRYINPYRQLEAYRQEFAEIIKTNNHLKKTIKTSRVGIINIFSGPVRVINQVPKSLPYYKLIQESTLKAFLYDYGSENKYDCQSAEILKKILPAKKWTNESDSYDTAREVNITKIEENVEKEIINFLKQDSGGVLLLESMNTEERDNWMRYLLREATTHNIPQVEAWTHSSRISKKIFTRTNIYTQSIYSAIYGNNETSDDIENEKPEDKESQEDLLQIIPIKDNNYIDKKALILIHEAHLISRTLNQSDLLRFGTGRLLEDMFSFLDAESERKIIFIGDPYSLTHGKSEDSAMNTDTLTSLYRQQVMHYRKPINFDCSDNKQKLRTELADSIENRLFNNLNYTFDTISLCEVDHTEIEKRLKSWFNTPLKKEPQKGILFYRNEDCQTTNQWIKKNCLKNGEGLAPGDLLIVNNNTRIVDATAFQFPQRIINGMYFTLLEKIESASFPMEIQQSPDPITLHFTKIRVKCLSLDFAPEAELWMLDNYFLNEGELTQEENIAFRVFIDQKIKKEKAEQTFESSPEFQQMQIDILFQELSPEEKNAIGYLITNYSLSKEEKQTVKTTQKARVLLSRYNKLYTKRITSWLRENDPLINAALFKYGWAITVHKAIGSSFDEIIMKAQRGENSGITNTDYFRWLYSGISTTERMVAISCPQYIHPLMKCHFEDSTSPAPVSVKVKTPGHSLRTFDNYDIESRFKEKLEAFENKNVIAAICELSKMLEQKGYLLESTRQHTVYMTKAIYSLPGAIDKQLILNIDNKSATKNWAVSSIRIEKADSADNTYIEECIRNFFQTSPLPSETPSIVTNLPTDFRKSIYSQWFRTFEENGLKANIINAYDYHDIFLAKKENDVIKFKVWYSTSEQQKTKGFINKIEVIEKTNEELSLQIKKLLLNE